MEPSRPRSETEHERLTDEPVAANPYRGTPPWQRGSGWKRGLAGLGAVLLTAGSIAAVVWLAFRDDGAAPEATGEVLSERCVVTEAEDAGPTADPLEPGEPAERLLATVRTNYGDLTIMLWGDVAPCGVEAFAHLALTGYYDAHECDRLTTQAVDPTAILRCGSPGIDPFAGADESAAADDAAETYGPGWRFQAETAMAGNDVADVLALLTDERGRAGSAFALIRGAAIPTAGVSVIGGIVDGYEVLDTIAALADTVAYDGAPPVPVEIWAVQLTELDALPTGPDTVGGDTGGDTATPTDGATSPLPGEQTPTPDPTN